MLQVFKSAQPQANEDIPERYIYLCTVTIVFLVCKMIEVASNMSSIKSELSAIYSQHRESHPFIGPFPGIPMIDSVELSAATQQWDNKRILGAGSFGTVYHGKWKFTNVAVKRISCKNIETSEISKHALRELYVEMKFLNAYRHDNILPLYGYSFDGESACLVYQLMVASSLEHRLHISQHRLSYRHRLNIAIGVAKAIKFLHTFKRKATVHGDIKSANILLDANLQPKLGDFGLARQTDGTKHARSSYGTRAYMSDEFRRNLVITTKNDVFSFGVVLFELATGRKSQDTHRSALRMLKNYMWTIGENSTAHKRLTDASETQRSTRACSTLLEMMKIGYMCTQSKGIYRPDMAEVLELLEEVHIS